MANKRRLPNRWIFLIIGIVWLLAYNFIFGNLFMKYLNAHPLTPVPLAFFAHEIGYMIMWGLFALALFKEPLKITRVALGAWFIQTAIVMAMPPVCVSTIGTVLTSPNNMTCLAGGDTFTAWLLHLVGVPYQPIIWWLVFFLGVPIYFIIGTLLLTMKQISKILKKA